MRLGGAGGYSKADVEGGVWAARGGGREGLEGETLQGSRCSISADYRLLARTAEIEL